MPKTDTQKTHDERVAEIAAIEAAAAQKRADLEAFNKSESIRRKPLLDLIQHRYNLQRIISINKNKLSIHSADAANFEKTCDVFFHCDPQQNQPGNHLAYHFLTPHPGYPGSMAARAVDILEVRLARAAVEMKDLESKIVTEAEENDLREMLPPELCK